MYEVFITFSQNLTSNDLIHLFNVFALRLPFMFVEQIFVSETSERVSCSGMHRV